jgi:predicted porin
VNASWATKEGNGGSLTGVGSGTSYPAPNPQASANPFSIAGTYNNGPAAAMLAYERNAVESKVWSVAGSFSVTPELKLMGTYSRQNQEHTNTYRPTVKGAELGATYAVGPGKMLVGFGLKKQDETFRLHDLITRQYSLGYEYSLSKRTYLYVDASRKTNVFSFSTSGATFGQVSNTATRNFYDVGLNHSF